MLKKGSKNFSKGLENMSPFAPGTHFNRSEKSNTILGHLTIVWGLGIGAIDDTYTLISSQRRGQ